MLLCRFSFLSVGSSVYAYITSDMSNRNNRTCLLIHFITNKSFSFVLVALVANAYYFEAITSLFIASSPEQRCLLMSMNDI